MKRMEGMEGRREGEGAKYRKEGWVGSRVGRKKETQKEG
jgi:hypothetical protein